MQLYFGFKNRLDIPKALRVCKDDGLEFNMLETSFFASRETLVPIPGEGMAMWRARLFAAMSRNAGSIVEYFNIPTNRVIELGTRVEI
jgi:KUP system potassium uptake protein